MGYAALDDSRVGDRTAVVITMWLPPADGTKATTIAATETLQRTTRTVSEGPRYPCCRAARPGQSGKQ